ncbi:hypothetical protein [Coleofasciculus sp. G2-EDA-02]|uniref:hypothetical protein n=1 Tax=Coleofasciculus sp. G2-EDA-02 TaxID=3069529 RepID=UPI00330050B4
MEQQSTVSNTKPSDGVVLEPQTESTLFDFRWFFQLPPMLKGVGVSLAACNTVVISFGLYSLLNAVPSNPALDRLERARAEYDAGNFQKAISLAKSIPRESALYQDSITSLKRWRREWYTAAAQYQAAEQALKEKRWRDVLEAARQMDGVHFWRRKVESLVEQAKPELEAEAKQLLDQAYAKAQKKDFTEALNLLKQIPPETTTAATIQPKLAEYEEKQRIKAEYLLQQAYNQAAKRDFKGALNYLSQIPPGTSVYETAQIKMAEYSQKQHFKEEVERTVKLAKRASEEQEESSEPFSTEPFISTETNEKTSELNPGNQLQEVTP